MPSCCSPIFNVVGFSYNNPSRFLLGEVLLSSTGISYVTAGSVFKKPKAVSSMVFRFLFAKIPDHFSEQLLNPSLYFLYCISMMNSQTGISRWTVNHLISLSSCIWFIGFPFSNINGYIVRIGVLQFLCSFPHVALVLFPTL